MPRVSFVGHRLDARGGIPVASQVWQRTFSELGFEVTTVEEADALADGAREIDRADIVVVEQCLAAPTSASALGLADALRGRRAILRHHDLAWQGSPERAARASALPPTDPSWIQVTINERSRLELAARGIRAETVYHHFPPHPAPGNREAAREALGVAETELLLLQPTRAVPWKNVAGGILLATALGATYWLLGTAEEGYGRELDLLVRRSTTRVIIGNAAGLALADAYAACDAVVLPSTWEGFGNATIESATARRPLAIGNYPVAAELRRYGFSWFESRDPAPLARHLASPDPLLTERNARVATMRFSTDQLAATLSELVARW